jgi:hypothetical protein
MAIYYAKKWSFVFHGTQEHLSKVFFSAKDQVTFSEAHFFSFPQDNFVELRVFSQFPKAINLKAIKSIYACPNIFCSEGFKDEDLFISSLNNYKNKSNAEKLIHSIPESLHINTFVPKKVCQKKNKNIARKLRAAQQKIDQLNSSFGQVFDIDPLNCLPGDIADLPDSIDFDVDLFEVKNAISFI